MKRNSIKFILVILAILISNGIVYSQIGYWEPTTKICKTINNVYRLSFSDNGDILATTVEGIFYSTNNGDTWIKTTTNNGLNYLSNSSFAIEHPISGSIFVGGNGDKGVIFRLSSKDGKFWEKVLELPNHDDFVIQDMVVTVSGDIYAVGYGCVACSIGCNHDKHGSIYYSSDNGNTWIEKIEGIPLYHSNGGYTYPFPGFQSLALATDGTLYATGPYGLYRLDDGENIWVKISNEIVRQITFSPDGSIFVAAYELGVLKSTDKGVTWEKTNKGLPLTGDYPNHPIFADNPYCIVNIIYNPVTNHLFITDVYHSLIYISTDLGESWNSDITSNLPKEFRMHCLAVNPKTGMVFVGYAYGDPPTRKCEVYRLKVTSKEDIEFYMNKEKGPTLVLENYPNPFNPITTIQYQLGENALVTLKVYDVMGREIATLINNKMQLKGSYSSTFNASGLSSGIYFYTLFANGKPYTQKMLLTK